MIIQFEDLSLDEQELINRAHDVMRNGYDPYSKFYVGAAVRAKSGVIFVGANLNACSYGGICAERVAIGAAITHREYVFDALAIISMSAFHEVKDLAAPCGICRQIIWEFSELGRNDVAILLSDTQRKRVLKTTISDIHPLGFGPRACSASGLEKYAG